VFTIRALMFRQQFNYALAHPNHIARLLVTVKECALLEKEPLNMIDLQKDPLTACLVHQFFRLLSSVLSPSMQSSRL